MTLASKKLNEPIKSPLHNHTEVVNPRIYMYMYNEMVFICINMALSYIIVKSYMDLVCTHNKLKQNALGLHKSLYMYT